MSKVKQLINKGSKKLQELQKKAAEKKLKKNKRIASLGVRG
jgi:hypothetical protein|tara:strand:+ start:7294 stop:7416 length:123 start_codon:yes stop_codon:yes gene_type:complete